MSNSSGLNGFLARGGFKPWASNSKRCLLTPRARAENRILNFGDIQQQTGRKASEINPDPSISKQARARDTYERILNKVLTYISNEEDS